MTNSSAGKKERRITIRVPEHLFNKLEKEVNKSEKIRSLLLHPQPLSSTQIEMIIASFDKIWDCLSSSTQERLMKDPIIIRVAELLESFREKEE